MRVFNQVILTSQRFAHAWVKLCHGGFAVKPRLAPAFGCRYHGKARVLRRPSPMLRIAIREPAATPAPRLARCPSDMTLSWGR